MSLNSTPASGRTHIAFFGRRNAGKSSLVNAVTAQQISVVSDVPGTTTDPVTKSMELLPLGPVVIIDTPGFDDTGALGEKRVQSAVKVLSKADAAVLVIDGSPEECDRELIELFTERKIPYLTVYTKADAGRRAPDGAPLVSSVTGEGIRELKERIARLVRNDSIAPVLVSDIIKPLDYAVLVTPIDSAAPKGRLILPQQQVIRDVLDAGAIPVVTRETELAAAMEGLAKKPSIVITDSQAFAQVAKLVPEDIPLTSFSILMARFKGFLRAAVSGADTLDCLKNGDRILISEGCTHHRQCEDIGTVKLPKWIKEYTGKELVIENTSGGDFPTDLSAYALVIHCGGCMLNAREMQSRMKRAENQNIPFTNYGTAIAKMKGILERSIAPLTVRT
ncbi:MAG: [FeFe] hydrogenase H-cluster maturation GTPase HydF [bacterium]|nr:[FeFe] hydrogenase H-cluster maturation GTPase HydF [bacterium]